MSGTAASANPIRFASGKRILALLPDDGTERRLLLALRQEKGITRVDSVAVRALSMLREAHTRSGQLPQSEMARLVTVIADDGQADDLFTFIFECAQMNRPGGGMLLMDRLVAALPFSLPGNVPDEGS